MPHPLQRLADLLRPSVVRLVGPPPAPPTRQLYALLSGLFTAEELRRFLLLQPHGALLVADLPVGGSPADLTLAAVTALERHGWIDAALFDALAQVRPRRRAEIARVARAVCRASIHARLRSGVLPDDDRVVLVRERG